MTLISKNIKNNMYNLHYTYWQCIEKNTYLMVDILALFVEYLYPELTT